MTSRTRSSPAQQLITQELIDMVTRVVKTKAFGLDADDHQDIIQTVLVDIWEKKPYLALPKNEGALVQHIRFIVLKAVRTTKRHCVRGELLGGRMQSFDDAFKDDDAS